MEWKYRGFEREECNERWEWLGIGKYRCQLMLVNVSMTMTMTMIYVCDVYVYVERMNKFSRTWRWRFDVNEDDFGRYKI